MNNLPERLEFIPPRLPSNAFDFLWRSLRPFRSYSALWKDNSLPRFFQPYGRQNSIICSEWFTMTVHLCAENRSTVNLSYCSDDPTLNDTIALIISAWRVSISKSKLASPKVSCKLFIVSVTLPSLEWPNFCQKLQLKCNANITWYNILCSWPSAYLCYKYVKTESVGWIVGFDPRFDSLVLGTTSMGRGLQSPAGLAGIHNRSSRLISKSYCKYCLYNPIRKRRRWRWLHKMAPNNDSPRFTLLCNYSLATLLEYQTSRTGERQTAFWLARENRNFSRHKQMEKQREISKNWIYFETFILCLFFTFISHE